MSKKSTKALASAALMSLVLTTALSAGPVKAAQGKVTRVSGADRYATASQVATTNWASGSDSVVLVSGEGYADAVSASALAKKLDAPIVLTEPGSLSADAQKALDTLKPKNVYVIGGNASISQSIRDGLKDKYTLTELGGANRYETNAAVADELVKLGVDASNVLVVGGEGFSDALSVAPVAAAKGQILLLAANDQAKTQPVIDFVKKNNSKVTVVGTKNVINDTIYNALGATSRVDGGADRFATNINVLKNFKDDLKSDKVYIANASIAKPDNLYADALVASAVAGKYSAPLVLVDKDPSGSTTDPNATDNAIAYLKDYTTSSTDFQVIGGTGVVSENTEDAINEIYNPTSDGDQASEVESIEATSLNQIKVTFNGKADSDTAEDVTNYEIDGDTLEDSDASATLQDDDKTVLITLADKQNQNDDVDVKVKKGILSEDKSNTIPEFTQTVTFADTTAPTLDSVSVRGNNKLDVKFSEPVKAQGTSEKSALQNVVSTLKINDKNLSSFGINYDTEDGNENGGLKYSALDDSVAVKNSDGDVEYYYTDEVELYFDDNLPTGDNTLKISDADDDTLSDAAGFPIADTTEDFTVDTLTTAPEITSITAEDSGKVYINFDRPLDAKTATDIGNYEINDNPISEYTSKAPELKKDDTQVKISGVSGALNKNSNTIYIDDNVEDAYGNNVADDTYESFTLDEDTTKPDVTSVSALNEDTIRVKFSKDVDATYATNVSNYTLKDNDGTDITDQIRAKNKDADGNTIDPDNDAYEDNNAITIPGKSSNVKDGDTTDVVDIHVGEDLTDSEYTLKVENIQDTASTPNVIDDKVVTFDGSSDVSATATAYKVSGDNEKIVFVFNKAMDGSTLNDTDNYEYVNGENDTKTLPSDADITVNGDNKSVTIDLNDTSLNTIGTDGDENSIKRIYATGVKDEDGNDLSVGNNGGTLEDSSSKKATVKANSLKIYYDNDDLKADVSFTQPIDEDNAPKEDFSINGQKPTSVDVDGTKVTLTFGNDTNGDDESDPDTLINTVKAAGNNAELSIEGIKDVLGNVVTDTEPIYSYDAAPQLIINRDDDDVAQKIGEDGWTATYNGADEIDIKVVFDTPIEDSSVRASDFTFSVGGTTVGATDAVANTDNTVRFEFTGDDFTDLQDAVTRAADDNGIAKIQVRPDNDSEISTVKDKSGDYAYYVPSDDDLKTTYVTLDTTTAPSTDATLTSSIGTVDNSAKTITDIPAGTTLDAFKDAITPADGATFKVYKADGTTEATDDLQSDYKVVVIAQDGTTKATYTVTVAE